MQFKPLNINLRNIEDDFYPMNYLVIYIKYIIYIIAYFFDYKKYQFLIIVLEYLPFYLKANIGNQHVNY